MIAIVVRSILNRWFSVALATFAIALGVALYLGIERVRDSAKASFEATISGVDLIVGARGGDVQILLYSVFNIGNATNNIQMTSLDDIRNDPQVAWVAPISLGDSHRGYRVVGTTNAFFDNVKVRGGSPLTFASGGALNGVFGAVIGSTVARELGYDLNQPMVVSHGLASAGTAEHDDFPFFVAGILEPTGSPIDKNVYVSLAGIEAIHMDWKDGARLPGRSNTGEGGQQTLDLNNLVPSQATAALVGVTQKRRIFQVRQRINDFVAEPLTAILPGIALGNLWAVMTVVESSFSLISLAAFLVSIMGLMALLNMSLNQRRREMAIYRSLGASPLVIAALLMAEALVIGVIAIILGSIMTLGVELVVSNFALNYASVNLEFSGFGLAEARAILFLLGATALAGVIPAIRLYRASLTQSLTVTE